MWRAGWTNTSMASRYIHSGAELEGKAYLERMGYAVESVEDKKIIVSINRAIIVLRISLLIFSK
jgi:hypothetical protein